MEKIRVGIVGYGHLGKGIELGLRQHPDMSLVGVFTRRDPGSLTGLDDQTVFYPLDAADRMTDQIDVMLLCGGSARDLPEQGPYFAGLYHTVDAFDTHARLAAYFEAVDQRARQADKTCVVAVGWDPGLFSLQRLMAEAFLPQGHTETFWGKGVSQGHSEAVRRVPGVAGAVQYTLPNDTAIQAFQAGRRHDLSAREKHKRVCYVVAQDQADRGEIEQAIKTMPHYFEPYDTDVVFISQEELARDHAGLAHGGRVIRTGRTGPNQEHKQLMAFQLQLDANPDFTALVMIAYARATVRLAHEGLAGAKTVADVAPAYLSQRSPEDIRQSLI